MAGARGSSRRLVRSRGTPLTARQSHLSRAVQQTESRSGGALGVIVVVGVVVAVGIVGVVVVVIVGAKVVVVRVVVAQRSRP